MQMLIAAKRKGRQYGREDIPTITFSGYGKFAVSKERPEVEFSNPATNFVDMQFTLIERLSFVPRNPSKPFLCRKAHHLFSLAIAILPERSLFG